MVLPRLPLRSDLRVDRGPHAWHMPHVPLQPAPRSRGPMALRVHLHGRGAYKEVCVALHLPSPKLESCSALSPHPSLGCLPCTARPQTDVTLARMDDEHFVATPSHLAPPTPPPPSPARPCPPLPAHRPGTVTGARTSQSSTRGRDGGGCSRSARPSRSPPTSGPSPPSTPSS